ncbi:helix-turn-helix domain-containing protein [Bradyrhizobium sp. 35]|nr:helix-turn-helix domain-containing protein [Bradyrhizobium sp. 35]
MTLNELPRLVTVTQAAEYLGLTASQVRTLVATDKIARTPVGARVMIPRDALDQWILKNTVQPCRDETQVPASAFSKSASASISSGQMADAAASAQRALRTASSLKAR